MVVARNCSPYIAVIAENSNCTCTTSPSVPSGAATTRWTDMNSRVTAPIRLAQTATDLAGSRSPSPVASASTPKLARALPHRAKESPTMPSVIGASAIEVLLSVAGEDEMAGPCRSDEDVQRQDG